MTTIGVNSTAEERWESGQPECGEDFCIDCGECLGCQWENPCFGVQQGYVNGERHVWLNEKGEAKL